MRDGDRQNHLHEILVMETLRRSEHVASLREYFVDEEAVHIVMVRTYHVRRLICVRRPQVVTLELAAPQDSFSPSP